MKWIICIFAAFILSACANPAMDYVNQNKPRAESGQLAWSTYYENVYNLYSNSSIRGKGAILGRLNDLILAAKSYEKGEITKDQFEYLRRKAQAEQTTDNEHARQAAANAYLENMQKQNAQNSQPTYQIVPPVLTQPANSTPLKQTDFACLNQCTKNGYAYGLCQSKCSY